MCGNFVVIQIFRYLTSMIDYPGNDNQFFNLQLDKALANSVQYAGNKPRRFWLSNAFHDGPAAGRQLCVWNLVLRSIGLRGLRILRFDIRLRFNLDHDAHRFRSLQRHCEGIIRETFDNEQSASGNLVHLGIRRVVDNTTDGRMEQIVSCRSLLSSLV